MCFKMFKKRFPPLSKLIMGPTDGNASFLRAARAGNLEKVLEYLKGSTDINTSNANGLNALHLASKEGHVNVVTELLKRGANVDAATKKGNTALHIASLAGQEEIVKILVQHGASVNVQSQNGFTPLYMAAQENHDNVVKFLLSNGANQSLATEDGFTPLAVALQQGHDKVVAVLLENDTRGKVRLPALHIAAKKDDCKAAALLLQNDHNPDVTSKSGFTPLHIAAHYGNENIATLLLQRGADVNFPAKHNITPMHVASKWGKTNMATLMLEKGANIEAKTRDGLTPLHCAARSGHDQVVEHLLDRAAPIQAKTKNGLAPLHMAAQGDHVDSARILLYHKAPVDDITVDYLTALHVAAHCGHVRVAKLLLDRKADPNSRALNGFTPLHIACKKNRIKVVELLLKHGASIEATTESGLTPLHVASFMGCMNIVIYLIQHGSNPDVPTVRGETPLHLAARANQTDIIRILLRNGAHVDAKAREQQTPLHIAARLGNSDIVALLLQHGASVDATTKDMYTALHIAAKEGQEEVASVLLEHGASLTATTKKGFTPLHLAAKYGNMKVARLLLQRDAPVDAQGKNGVTPLHVAAHYDNQNVALLLLDKGASPHATAKNGYTPLHIAAKKNQMDIATTLLEYGAKSNAESKAGFTPLHLAAQEGHTDMSTLLIEHQADVNAKAKNGLTPLHLCAQEDKVNVAAILVKSGAEIESKTKAGYTPLHVACHFGQINMVRFLLQHNADVNSTTSVGYTPLHQAAQQGHTQIISLLLEHRASPNAVTNQGQTALSIAQRLGYISVVETLKIVTETVVTTTTTTVTEEKYRVVAPETMQETFMSDSEDEGGEDTMLGDQSYRYLTVDEMKSLGDDSLPIDPTRDERIETYTSVTKDTLLSAPPPTADEDQLSPAQGYAQFTGNYAPDNIDISRSPVHAGFLVSFMVDARGGAMRGCRHSGVRVIIPPRKAPMPMRITCRYLKKEKLAHPPPLMEGEACASRILEMGPTAAKFLGPVIIEVPHFASLRGKEREITILRSDNGETWREHSLEASEEAVQEVLNESFDGEELSALDDLNTNRITRILTTDFPQYFAIITRIRQEVHAIGPEGGMVSSTVVPQVQAVFPEGALTKKIKVGLQAQPIPADLVAKMLGNRVAVSPVVTVEPRRRKFHKPITLTIPVPQAAARGMINQYSGDAPTLRLLCSITGGTTRAQWEDVTGSTPLTFVNDCVSFTTTVSARFWLMDCRNISEATKMATELYREAIHVPFMAKFVVFAKRHDPLEAKLRVFCMTDDKEDKTLESQEHFIEVAKSRDVEVLEAKPQYVEFAGNLVPVTKSGEQLSLNFHAFRENRLPFVVRVKDPHQEPIGRIAFMREAKVSRGEPPQTPICNLNITLPDVSKPEPPTPEKEVLTLEKKYAYLKEMGLSKPETIHKADLRLSDIARRLGNDWVVLALQLDMPESDINLIKSEYPDDVTQQAMVMLRLWMQLAGNKATGNTLEKALRKINREDIVNQCIFNVELVTDDMEKAVAKVHLDQSGFDTLKEELGPSRETSLRRDISLDVSYDEQDIMKEAESAEETSSETGSIADRQGRTETTAPDGRRKRTQPKKDEETLVEEPIVPVTVQIQRPPPPPPHLVKKLIEVEPEKPKREPPKVPARPKIIGEITKSPSPTPKPVDTTEPDKEPVAEEIIVAEVVQPTGNDTWVSLWSDNGDPKRSQRSPVAPHKTHGETLADVEALIISNDSIKEEPAAPTSIADSGITEIHRSLMDDTSLTTCEIQPTPPQRKKRGDRRSGTFGPDAGSASTPTATTPTPPAPPITLVTFPSLDGEGDEREAARLAESETWTSQELDRSTPDVLERVSVEDGKDTRPHKQVEEKEWTETTDSGIIKRKVRTVTYTSDGSAPVEKDEDDQLAEADKKVSRGSPDATETSKALDTKAEDSEAGIVEETVPFAQRKDFFQKLVDGHTTETVVTSEKTVVEKRVITQQSRSKESSVERTSPEAQGEVVEEVVPFAERVQFFRRSLEESAIAKDLEKPEWKAKPERPPPPSPVKVSEKVSPIRPPPPIVEKSEKEPPQIPPRPLAPPQDEEDSKSSLPVAPPRKSKQLPLKTSPEEQTGEEEMSPFTPDLETPKDTPEMASKSAEQKMEMVTERVAEAASTLASTLESVEKKRLSPEPEVAKTTKPVEEYLEEQPEPIEKIEAKISSILTMVTEQEQQLQTQELQEELLEQTQFEEQPEELQLQPDTRSDKIWGEVESQVEEAMRDTETMEFELEEEEARLQESKEADDELAQDADVSSIGESMGDADEGKAVKAEIKLLVKTMELGKEAIEIRSIREFVEKDAKPKDDIPKVFSGVMSYSAAEEGASISPTEEGVSVSPTDEGQLIPPLEDTVEGKRADVVQEHDESIMGDARGSGEGTHEDKPEDWEIIDDSEIKAVKDTKNEDEVVEPTVTKLTFKEAEAASQILTTQSEIAAVPFEDSYIVSDKMLIGDTTLLSEKIEKDKVVHEESYMISTDTSRGTIKTFLTDETLFSITDQLLTDKDAVEADESHADEVEKILCDEVSDTCRPEIVKEVKPTVSFKFEEVTSQKVRGDGVVQVASDIVSEMLVKAQEVVEGDEVTGSTMKTILQVERKMVVDIDTCLERMGLEDFSLSKPSPDDYPAESSATGDYAAAKSLTVDKDVARVTPTDESLEDHAQVDKIITDAGGDSIEKLGRLEIELAEVRTEDEAPEIEEDILTPDTEMKSLLGERGSLGSLSSIDELRQLHSSGAPSAAVSDSKDVGKQLQISKVELEEKTPEETVVSEQTVTEGAAAWSEITEYFKYEAVRKHADHYDPRSVKLPQQSSLEVEVSSRTSEDLPLSDIVDLRSLQQPICGDQQIIEKVAKEVKESVFEVKVDDEATAEVESSAPSKPTDASLEEMSEACPASIAESLDHLTQPDKLPPTDQQVELEKVVPSPTKQSLPQQTIIISDVVSPLSKLSPIEPPSSAVESEISPAVEYPTHLSAQHQVHVGVSPTEFPLGKQSPSESSPGTVPVSVSEDAIDIVSQDISSTRQDSRKRSIGSADTEDFGSKVVSECIPYETSDRSDTDTTQTETTAIGLVSKVVEEDFVVSGRESQMETTVSDFSDREESFEQDVFTSKPAEVAATKVQEFRSSVVESSSSVYSSRTESTDSESDVSSCRRSVHMAFENRAFAGVDEIDDSTKIEQPSDVSPFEVPRPNLEDEIREVMDAESSDRQSTELQSGISVSERTAGIAKITIQETQFRKEIFTQEMSESLEKISPEQKKLYETEKDTPSTVLDIHIKQEMVARELEETEDFSFEEKDLHQSSSIDEQSLDQGEKMAKQIRSDIFTHELDETIDSGSLEEKDILSQSSDVGRKVEQYVAHRMRSDIFSEAMAESPNEQSPEQKDLPVFPHEFDKEDEEEFARHKERLNELQRKEAEAEVIIKSAHEQCPEPVLWEVSVQEQADVQVRETAQEIPPSKQVIIEKDEEEDREGVTLDELQPKGVFELCHTRVVKKSSAIDGGEEDKAKVVTSRHPRLEHIPSEISEEDLVEKFDASPDKDVEDEPVFLQCTQQKSLDTQPDDEKKDPLSQTQTSSMEITDEDLRASSDELSPIEKHTERLESMTTHEVLHKQTLEQLQSEQMQQEVAGTLDQKFKEAEMESEELKSTLLLHKKEKSERIEEVKKYSEEMTQSKVDSDTGLGETEPTLATPQTAPVEEATSDDKKDQRASFTKEVSQIKMQEEDHSTMTIRESETVTCDSHKELTTTSEETLIETSKETSVLEDVEQTKSTKEDLSGKKISRTSSSEESSDTYKVKRTAAESMSSATESESDEMHAELLRSKTQRTLVRKESSEKKLKTVEESFKKRERVSHRIQEEDSSTPDSSGEHKFADRAPIEGRVPKAVLGEGESYSSSGGESHFYSFETDSGMTSRGTPAASRPCSSDVEALVAGAPGSSEYETCVTSQEVSSTTATSSQEYKTAATSISHSSRESMRSIDSDSSGHLGSLEVSSETSETFVPSAMELERDMETPVIDDEKYFASESVREPYERAIPEPIIRGHEAMMPPDFSLKLDGSKKAFSEVEPRRFGRDGQVKYEELDEPSSPFEVVSESEVADFEDNIPEYGGRTTEAAAADAGKDDLQLKSERPKAYSSDSSGRLTVERSASPDTDDTSTDYHSASEGGPVQLTPQHSGSSLTDYELHHSERLIRATMYRQESGAYMAGEKVDDLSPSHEEQSFFPASQGDADAAQKELTESSTSVQRSGTQFYSHTDTEATTSTSVAEKMRVSSHSKSSESTTEAAESSTTITTTTTITRSEKPKTITEPSVYSQANGPVEVDFIPEYDDGDDGQHRRAQHLTSDSLATQGLDDALARPEETTTESSVTGDRTQKPQRSRCKEDKDDERKEEDESEDKDKEKDIGDMEESEVLFGEQAFEYPRVVTSTDVAGDKGSDEELSGAESETDDHEGQEQAPESSHQAPTSTEYGYEAAVPSAPTLAQMPIEPEDEHFPHDLEVDRPESELRDLDSSRPQSHAESFYSRSDSDQRPYSELQFSDDRPDSELTELMRQSSDGKEIPEEVEEVERPPSPEPKDEYRIQDEMPDVVAETKAVVGELEEGFGITRTTTGRAVVFEGDDDRPGALVRAEKMEDMSCLAEKHEYETSERSLKEKVELSVDIPNITVTQCPTPTKDKKYEFPDASDDQKASREITPSTEGSDKASDSASSQEYILQQMEEKFVEEKARIDSQSSEPFEVVEAPDDEHYEIILEEEIHAVQRPGEHLPDVCALPREPISEEYLPDQQEVANMMTSADVVHEISSPPTVKPIDVRYFPEYEGDAEEVFESELPEKGEKETAESYKFMRGVARDPRDWLELQFEGEKVTRAVTGFGYQMEFEKGYVREGEMYMHEEPLEDILEEGEKQEDEEEEKRDKDSNSSSCPKESTRSTPEFDILAGRKFFSKSGEHDDVSMSSLQEFERLEAEIICGDRRSSLGSQDSLNGRKIHSRSGQGDDVSVSSLTEFEHLEHECVAAEQVEKMAQDEAARLSEIEEGHESQVSESESQETLSEHGHDDDSDVDDYDKRMFEIDEIIRQAQSNVERFEAEKSVDIKIVSSGKIKHIPIRGQLDSGSGGSGDATESSLLEKTPSPEVEDEADADSLDGGEVKELDADPPLPPPLDAALRQATLAQHVLVSRTFSSDSSPHRSRGHSSASTTTQYDVESLREREYDLEEGDGTGIRDCDRDSLQGDEEDDVDGPGEKAPPVDGDADSLREDKPVGFRDEFDSDSLKGEAGAVGQDTSSSGKEYDRDSLGKGGGGGDGMVSSTDSLEPSSSAATHATYQYETDSIMSSSFASVQTSGEDSTMVSSTDTLDPELQPPRSSGVSFLPSTPPQDVRPFLLERDTSRRYIDSEGNLQTEATFRTYMDSEGNVTGGEEYPTTFPSTVKRTVMMEPEVRTVTFAGPDAERQMQDFIAQFQPGEDVVEMETTDDQGNVHVVRTVQHRVVMPPRVSDLQFTGDDAEEKLHELVTRARRELRTTEDEDVEESTDEHGNVRRVIRRRIVQPEVHTMTFSGPDARQQMEEFMRSAIPDFDPSHPIPETETCDTQGNLTRVVRHSAINGDKGPSVSMVHTTHEASADGLIKGQTDLTRHAGLHIPPPVDPTSPAHSSSSHSEDCYCGPEAGGSTLPDPHGARLLTGDGFDQMDHGGTNSNRVVRRHVRTVTTVDADGRESTLVVEEQDEDGEEDGENGGPLRDSMQEILDQFLMEDGERQPPQRDT